MFVVKLTDFSLTVKLPTKRAPINVAAVQLDSDQQVAHLREGLNL